MARRPRTRQDPQVPPEVEQYLVQAVASAGALGGAVGGSAGAAAGGAAAAGAAGGARGGARGGAFAARRMRTVVAERAGRVDGGPSAVIDRLTRSLPRSVEMPPGGESSVEHRRRFAVPIGRTGLQQVVVDVEIQPAGPDQCDVRLRGYAKEGLLSRHPAQRTVDAAWDAAASP